MPVAGERAAAHHLRYLDLVLAGLRISAADQPTALPALGPYWAELSELWNAPEG